MLLWFLCKMASVITEGISFLGLSLTEGRTDVVAEIQGIW